MTLVHPRIHNLPQHRDSPRYLKYQRGLINHYHETGILPTIKVLDDEVTKIGELAVAGGIYSDIWVCGSEKKDSRCLVVINLLVYLFFIFSLVALRSLRNVKASYPKAKRYTSTLYYVVPHLSSPLHI